MLSKPNSAPSVGSRSDTSMSTASRSRTALRILGAIQPMDDEAARRALAFPGAVERRGQPARKARVLGLGRARHAWRRHRAHAQFPEDSLPCLRHGLQDRRNPPASRLTGPSAGNALRLLWQPRSTYSVTHGTWPHRRLRGAGRSRGRGCEAGSVECIPALRDATHRCRRSLTCRRDRSSRSAVFADLRARRHAGAVPSARLVFSLSSLTSCRLLLVLVLVLLAGSGGG